MIVSSHVLAEVAQVVDRVVVINKATLVNESDIGALSASRVVVRVDRTEPMVKALKAAETDFEVQADGAISITGRDAAEIGGIATVASVTVTELSKRSASESLEAMFLAVTGGERR